MTEEPLFRSTHAALVFAFRYASQQSPKTPLMSLILNPGDQSGHIGTGKGLVGLDAAAQAGMILSHVDALPDDQHNIIVAKYCREMHECKCCGQPAPREEWKMAVSELSHYVEMEGVHRRVRLIMVEKAVIGGKIDMDLICKTYSLSKSTTYRQLAEVKLKIKKIERMALINLDNSLSKNRLLVA